MFFGLGKSSELLPATQTLPGRSTVFLPRAQHAVLGNSLSPAILPHLERAIFALGCFWGAERIFWNTANVFTTAVGYAGGQTPNPTYEEVCSGQTNHTEVVLVVYDPKLVSYDQLLKLFWESHNPTQGMRQGNDRGTQYRSAIYTFSDAQMQAATASKTQYDAALQAKGFDPITTEIAPAGAFYYAEEYHQQYLHKNPAGYCGIGGTGVRCELSAVGQS